MTREEGEQMAASMECSYFETSAKKNIGVAGAAFLLFIMRQDCTSPTIMLQFAVSPLLDCACGTLPLVRVCEVQLCNQCCC